jgi:topoisomerase-4 subunit A
LTKYGKGRERKTEIKSFQSVTAVEVIANNQKLYVNRADGFVGYGLKRDEYICDCSELDDVVAIRKDGKLLVSRIQEKAFMGKDIWFVGIWKKGDERMVYNVIYSDGKSGQGFVKRFNLPGMIRDKEYDLTQGHPNSRLYYVSGNPNGEAEQVEVKLSQSSSARKKIFKFDFAELEVKGRGARGNILTKYPLRKVDFLKAGGSTLSKLDLWYDADAGRINKEKRGKYLGKFEGDDQLIAFGRNGSYKITSYDVTNRYEPEKTLLVERFNPEKPISAVYVDGESKQFMVKRFLIETSTADKEFGFISEGIGSRLVVITTSETPEVEVTEVRGKDKEKVTETVNLEEIIEVKGWKAQGNRLSQNKVTNVTLIAEPEETGFEEGDEDNLVEAADSGQKKKKNLTTTSGSKKGSKPTSSPSRKSQNTKSPQTSKKKVSPGNKSKSSSKTSSAAKVAKKKTAAKKSSKAPKKAKAATKSPAKTAKAKKVVKTAKKKR